MPVGCEIDPSHRTVSITIAKSVTDDELFDVAERILNDARFPSAARILWDAQKQENVCSLRLVMEMLNLLGRNEMILRASRTATIASQGACFGLQRLFAQRAESISLYACAFYDLDLARRWLEEADVHQP